MVGYLSFKLFNNSLSNNKFIKNQKKQADEINKDDELLFPKLQTLNNPTKEDTEPLKFKHLLTNNNNTESIKKNDIIIY